MTDDTGRGSAAGGSGGKARRAPAAASGGEGRASSAAAPAATGADPLAPRRGLRQLVGGVVLAEGVALLGATVFLVVELFVDRPTETGGAIAQAVITLVIGLGLLQLGRLLLRADERARIPVLVWQALQLSIGWPAWSSSPAVAIVLVVTALVAGVGVFVPGVLRPDVRGLAEE